ncbi:MAG: L-threonylcarbamoyladenylate synthase, partial [Clostridia bacterium]
IDKNLIAQAAEVIKNGGLVAFPTETVYGLGADTFNPRAIAGIYRAKNRPMDNPLISHICSMEQAYTLAEDIPEAAKRVMEHFWGGPLTVILKRKNTVPPEVSAGLDTVSIRFPSHSIAYELIKQSGTAIAAPSANLSGSPSPTTAKHCIDDMLGRVDMIIDGGDSLIGLESTVVDMSGEVPTILRPGAITAEEIAEVAGQCIYGGNYSNAPRCPGMKYTHYSPKADVYAVSDMSRIQSSEKAAVLSFGGGEYGGYKVYNAGDTVEEYAAKLFYFLRKADEDGIKTVYARLPEEKGIGIAVRNRLLKSAGGKVIE